MEENQLLDDFTLGDVIQKKKSISPKMIYIIFGVISFIILITIIIVIIATSSQEKPSDQNKEKGESEENGPQEPSNIAEINCIYDVDRTTSETVLLGEEFQKNSKFYIFINDKRITYSKTYKFNKVGEQLVKFDIYEDINMDNMFKNVPNLIFVEMVTKNKISILSMKSTFESCINLIKVNITGKQRRIVSTNNESSKKYIFYVS